MEAYKKILKKVGIALIVVGCLDIACMVYCISNKINYSSSFNIFAVIAGIFLLRNSVRSAQIVTFFAAFMLTAFIGLLAFSPFMEPLELRVLSFKQNPISSAALILLTFAVVGFVYWVYRELSSEVVMAARKEAGLSYGIPKLAFVLGGILIVTLSVVMYFLNNGTNAEIAKNKAKIQCGEDYKYHVTAMNFSGGYVFAQLTAYNEDEIKSVRVEWGE